MGMCAVEGEQGNVDLSSGMGMEAVGWEWRWWNGCSGME